MTTSSLSPPAVADRTGRWFDELKAHFEIVAARATERRSTLLIAGVPIEFRFAGKTLHDALYPALAHHPAVLTPEWQVLIAESQEHAPMPACHWGVDDVGPRGEVAVATVGPYRTSYVGPSNVLSTIDMERRIAIFRVPDVRTQQAAPFRTLLHWILSEHGRRLVHAAAVAPPGSNIGVLLAGAGGSGKSTTAMLCLNAGFHYAGDDYTAVSPPEATNGPRAHSLFATAKLTTTSLALLPFLTSGIRLAPTKDEKGVIDLTAIWPERVADSITLGALIVPRVRGGKTRVSRTSQAEALRALAPTTLLQLPGNGNDTFRDLSRLAASLPAWSLDLGDDLDSIPGHVASTLEDVR
ncbi:MAG TPA: hypothetical protein VF701_06320 [Thermoanaerobaculia bacterium]